MKYDLPIKRLLYEISSNKPLQLHGYLPTVTFRGAFGYSLFQILARDMTIPSISEKALLYKNMFYPDGLQTGSSHSTPSRPFVMRGDYSREDRKSFIIEMMLFGRAIDAEILVDNIINNMCRMGIGEQSIPCNCYKIYSEELFPEKPSLDMGTFKLNMHTPARIKSEGCYLADSLPFFNLIARLDGRLRELITIYTDNEVCTNSDNLLEEAKRVSSFPVDIKYFTTSRTSTRSDMKCDLSGMTGSMLYTGNLKPFEDILSYLPWVHIGSSAAFGCGWCTIEFTQLI